MKRDCVGGPTLPWERRTLLLKNICNSEELVSVDIKARKLSHDGLCALTNLPIPKIYWYHMKMDECMQEVGM